MLTIDNLTFGYRRGRPILHNITVTLNQGFTLLVGENGSGKSTLMKILTGALSTKTPILIDGQPLDTNLRKQRMTYLPQEFDVYPSLKVDEVLRFIALSKGVKKGDLSARIQDVAALTNTTEFLRQKFKQCSIGTQRRVGIAAALLGNPDIVILDEPTAGVDPRERARFYQMIQSCFADKTVLMATHILDDVDILADHVLMLSSGRVTYDGSYQTFRHSLDDRLYELAADNLEPVEEQWVKTHLCLGQTRRDGQHVYRLAAKPGEVPPTPRFQVVSPTLEDLWSYHQEAASHE